MGKTQYYCAATLDGYIADADDGIDWLMGYEGSFDGEGAEASPMSDGGSYESFYEDVGALVSGSVTYEFVLDHIDDPSDWPYMGKPYWVLSSRELEVPDAEGMDVRVTKPTDIADLHAEMTAAAGGKNLWVVGGGNVASQFADAGLLDELLLTVVPVVLGEGKPLFDRGLGGRPLQLTGTAVHDTGMVALNYEIRR
jgi:dihydrofolate reductase